MAEYPIRTQIYLGHLQHRLLREKAKETNKKMAELVREAISEYLGISAKEGQHILAEDDPIWNIVGMANSGITDGSINHDHYLYGAPKKK
ncbi:hypothetical protein ISS37_07750 [candidate division KSB1 bacterium]|nr:hypothetical protein [candidate division KSB1 bacterium]